MRWRVLAWAAAGPFVLALGLFATAGCRADDASTDPAEFAEDEATAKRQLDRTWRELRGRPVLVVTHPTKSVLKSIVALQRNNLLRVPDLFVLGLSHAHESTSYRQARLFAQPHASWIGFQRLRCAMSEEDVYQTNRCTRSFKRIVRHATGILFTGGADMPPALYGERMALTTMTADPLRHYWETSFLFHLVGGKKGGAPRKALLARRPTLPVLALCLGMQQLNVAAGGTLIQDIPSQVYRASSYEAILALPTDQHHRNPMRFLQPARGVGGGVMHRVRFTGAMELWRRVLSAPRDTPLAPVSVLSAHHQAVGRLGRQLEIVATSMDGKIAEALRHRQFTHLLALQFHPERHELWSPAVRAKLSADHPVRNVYARTLATDKRTLALHTGLWRLFAEWLVAEWAKMAAAASD